MGSRATYKELSNQVMEDGKEFNWRTLYLFATLIMCTAESDQILFASEQIRPIIITLQHEAQG
jgi:hypothetical protein